MHIHRYVAVWVLAALAAVIALTAATADGPLPWVPIVAVTVVTAVADRVELNFEFERHSSAYSIAEVALTAALLLAGPIPATVGGTAGMAIAQATRDWNVPKVAFNSAQAGVGMAIASAVMLMAPAVGPTVNGYPVLGAVGGMIVYVGCNLGAMTGLLSLLGGREARHAIGSQIPLTTATMVGQIASGVVVATVVVVEPWLTPLVLAPVAAIYLAARGATRTTDLITRLRTERDRLTRVIDGTTDGIVLLDHAGRVQLWNPAMARMTGIDQPEAAGRTAAELLTDQRRLAEQPVRDRWLIDDAHDGPPSRELTAELVHTDGSIRAIRESHALMFDERGRCVGDVIVIRDVTRQQELDRLRTDFVARVSHELRTPLTPIRGYVEVLLRRGDRLSHDDRTRALERILERTDHLGTLVEDLLLVTQLDQGDASDVVKPRPIALQDTVADAVARAKNRDPEREIGVEVNPDLPQALADDGRTGQILDVLIDNACTYSPANRPVQVEIDQNADDVRVRVIDHGPGVPTEQRQAVFEQFHRLEDPLAMRTSGVGLGLFIARQLAHAMHGSLEVVDRPPGAGATFELRLPTADPVDGAIDGAHAG